MSDLLSEGQFHEYKRSRYRIEPGRFARTVEAFNDKTGKQVGFLGWDAEGSHVPEHQRNAISNVEVHKTQRGRGIATAMLGYAQSMNPNLRHSGTLTPEGKAWAAKHPLGGSNG